LYGTVKIYSARPVKDKSHLWGENILNIKSKIPRVILLKIWDILLYHKQKAISSG
jgi:hypothetical protein